MPVSLSLYLTAVVEVKNDHPEWRWGQTYFNVLYDLRPDLSERVRATDLDPFHDDERIPKFLAFITRAWNGES